MQPNKTDKNEKLADQSPDDAKQTVKDKVSRGVATVAGALEGFVEQARKNDLPEKSQEALKKAAETTRSVASTTKEEGKKVKEAVTGGGSGGQSSGGSSMGQSGGSSLGGTSSSSGSRQSTGIGSSQSGGAMGGGSGGANSPSGGPRSTDLGGNPGTQSRTGIGMQGEQNAHGSMRDTGAGQGVPEPLGTGTSGPGASAPGTTSRTGHSGQAQVSEESRSEAGTTKETEKRLGEQKSDLDKERLDRR